MMISYEGGLTSTGELPFIFHRRSRIVVSAAINGAVTQVLLDSGAEKTIIDQRLAGRLRLRQVGSTWLSDRQSVTDVSIVGGLEATFGTLRLEGLEAVVADLAPIGRMTGLDLGLVLGREIFEDAVVDIDFEKEVISFSDPSEFTSPPGSTSAPLKRFEAGYGRVVDVLLEDHATVELEFDLGSANPIALQHGTWSSMPMFEHRPRSNSLIGGTGGIREVALVSLSSISVAGNILLGVDCLLEPARGQLDDRLGKGVLGMPIWSGFRVITDYSRDVLHLLAADGAGTRQLPRNRSGLRVLHERDSLRVLLVAEHSPAAATGWQAGEIIVRIDGRAITEDYWKDDLCRWAERAPGTKVFMNMEDGTERRLVLADYY